MPRECWVALLAWWLNDVELARRWRGWARVRREEPEYRAASARIVGARRVVRMLLDLFPLVTP